MDDPAFRAAVRGERDADVIAPEKKLASQPSLSRLTDLWSHPANLQVMREAVTKMGVEHILTRNGGARQEEVILDVDAMPLDVHGKQQGGVYHGHYKRKVFLPLFASCGESGDVLGAALRPGNQREVTDRDAFIVRVASAVQAHAAERVIVRLDAGFSSGALCDALEAQGIDYVMRLRKNAVLEEMAHDLTEGVDLEETQHYEATYAAQSWHHARRVVVVAKPERTLYGYDSYFLVTSLSKEVYAGDALVAMYGRRGKAEMHQGEMKAACSMSLSSYPCTKSHYRNRTIERPASTAEAAPSGVRAQNAVSLQIYMMV